MRKRSSYRPKAQLPNPLSYVINGFLPLREAVNEVTRLRITNHGAMDSITKGKGTIGDVLKLHHAMVTAESMARLGTGGEHLSDLEQADVAIKALLLRGEKTGRYLCTGAEISAINLALEIHDAQMDNCTIEVYEKAIKSAVKEQRAAA